MEKLVTLSIVKVPDPVLKQKCVPLTPEELSERRLSTGESLEEVLFEMVRLCEFHKGLGLSAPQVGINKRFFIARQSRRADRRISHERYHFYLNPVLVSKGGMVVKDDEGCLSLPGKFMPISRADSVETGPYFEIYCEDNDATLVEMKLRTKEQNDLADQLKSIGSTTLFQVPDEVDYRKLYGLDARVFQHELDHLDGILITDRLSKKDREKYG